MVSLSSVSWAAPKVELFSSPQASGADRAYFNQVIQKLEVDLISPSEMGRDWKWIEQSALSIVKKLVDSTDGSAPIYVAFTEGRGIEGGILYSAQGPRLLTLSVGGPAGESYPP